MHQRSRPFPLVAALKVGLAGVVTIGVLAGSGFVAQAVGSVKSDAVVNPGASSITPATATPPTAPPRKHLAPPAPVAPVAAPVVAVVRPPARVFATGNPQLDALLQTLPAVLFDGKASVHYGYNPLDTCCHAGGYNPGPNAVWVGPSAFKSVAELTYVTAHELGHSLHLHSAFGPKLTAAVAGAPSVRPGSPWDVSEKVADCVAWVFFPVQTAAAGITYWTCPEPWRSQVRAALS